MLLCLSRETQNAGKEGIVPKSVASKKGSHQDHVMKSPILPPALDCHVYEIWQPPNARSKRVLSFASAWFGGQSRCVSSP